MRRVIHSLRSFDHHASPNAIDSSLDQIADAVETAGVRAVLCYEVSDRNGPAEAQAGIGENVRFLHAVTERPGDLLRATFGLHASLSLSDRTLERCVAAAVQTFGSLDILINNVGVGNYKNLVDTSAASSSW